MSVSNMPFTKSKGYTIDLIVRLPDNDYEHFNFSHAQKPYLEFPVEQGDEVYAGGSPGADRVVIGSIATDFKRYVPCCTVCWFSS